MWRGNGKHKSIQTTQIVENMKNMKNLYRVALLAALGLGAVTVANAQEMYLGFNDAAGPTSAQNDYVIDLGASSQFTTTASLNLSSDFNASTFNTAFGSDGSSLSDVAVGAVAGVTSPSVVYFQTGTLAAGTSAAKISSSAALAASLSGGEYSSATSGGWSSYVAVSPILPGSNPPGSIAGDTSNPLSQLTSGIITESLYEAVLGTGRTPTVTITDVGTFDINLNNDSITYAGVSAVPEPATYGLLAAGGLLIVALRRQVTRKNA
jgi:hypothetical protein